MKALRVGLAISIVTTALAGLYFVVYLYRWEMHRALVSGVVFLAGEIALATSLVLRRIEQLRVVAPPAAVTTPDDGGVTARETPARLPWLGADRFGVFVPILLGAGAIVSGVAWVVEHLAKSTVTAGSGDHLQQQYAALAPPTGGFLGPGPAAPPDQLEPPVPPPLGRLGQITVAMLVGGLVVALLTLALLGRSRSDPPTAGVRSVITFEVQTRNDLDVDLAARSLWEACHPSARTHRVIDLRRIEPHTYQLTLEPALGEQTERRVLGCLSDGTLEQVHADVQSHERVSSGA
jgi:hypothetical protein